MKNLTATEAARNFSDVLDHVEHDGETFVVTRNGHPVARIAPVTTGNAAEIIGFLRANPPDPELEDDIRSTRALLFTEERNWNG